MNNNFPGLRASLEAEHSEALNKKCEEYELEIEELNAKIDDLNSAIDDLNNSLEEKDKSVGIPLFPSCYSS